MTNAALPHGDSAGTILGHPKGLFVLFFAEMWERFSYYGMRALLIFYLTKHWLFSDGEAGVIYGAYTALVYITPVLGGYLADRYLGQRKAVLFGAVLLTFGHFLMGFEGDGDRIPPASTSFGWRWHSSLSDRAF
jgi:proton-dependent oligopeptide transporter, POT family